MNGFYDGRCVFLDRDGTIIVHRHYLSEPEGVELLPGAAAGIRALRRRGLPTFVVSNQSGIGRGLFSYGELNRVNDRMFELLRREGASLDGIYVCPHTPEGGCECRKPAPGLLRRAAREIGANLSRSIVVGDQRCDIELGASVGATTVLVRTGCGSITEREEVGPDFVIDTLSGLDDVVAGVAGRDVVRTR
jgi:D-glycero-D-manno-heptose 1,7-bisphosphate phosphatase